MVDIALILEALTKQLDFHKSSVNSSSIPGDVNRAQYGIEQTEGLINLIDRFKPEFSKSQLKQIESKLTNLTRGVEYFEDYQTEIRNRDWEIQFMKYKKS